MTEDQNRALAHFKKMDPVLYKAAKVHMESLSRGGTKKTNAQLFEALCESVVSQQLSVKASDTIWNRLKEAVGGTILPESILATSLPRMHSAGLSAAKAKTLKELAKTIQKGLILSSLGKKSAEEAIEILTEVWGIGPWTSEMFLMFGLGHPDIFSVRDLGLVRSMEHLYGLPKNTLPKKLETIAEQWSPYRTIACRILWRARDTKGTTSD